MPGAVSIDLVVPTVGRTVELERFLGTVAQQTWAGPLRVILVDQNPDNRLATVVDSFRERLTLLHVQSAQGASRACNEGFRHCTADIVGRPDDDCWYPPDVLEHVASSFGEHPEWDALSGICCDEDGRPTQLSWDAFGGPIDRKNVFRRALATTLFMRRPLIQTLGDWDESFGPRLTPDGKIRGAAEESEYILRALGAGFSVGYDPRIRVHHPDYSPSFGDRNAMEKAYSYGVDHVRLLRKYRFPLWYLGWRVGMLFAASTMFLAKGQPGKARFYAAMARGRAREALTHAS